MVHTTPSPCPVKAETMLRGMPITEGIAIGRPFFFSHQLSDVPCYSLEEANLKREIDRYQEALYRCKQNIVQLYQNLDEEGAKEAGAIIRAYTLFMEDHLLNQSIKDHVYQEKSNVEHILTKMIEKNKTAFNHALKGSVISIEDVVVDVIDQLLGSKHCSIENIPKGSIVIARFLFPSNVARMNRKRVEGIIIGQGGKDAHVAIIAKSKQIPCVSNVTLSARKTAQSSLIVLDGCSGAVVVNPSANTLNSYRRLQQKMKRHFSEMEKFALVKAETKDGHAIKLLANIASSFEMEDIHKYGAQGVGLFRSEYIALNNEALPEEDEQVAVFKHMLEQSQGKPLVIRLFDFGGDKVLRVKKGKKKNPLGSGRGVRLLLKHPKLLQSQIRAILKVYQEDNVRILVPMVSCLNEFLAIKTVVTRLQREQDLLCQKESKPIAIGCMIELPSAVEVIDLLAVHADFFSIGTNDLIYFSLGVNRETDGFDNKFWLAEPSILRMIDRVVKEAKKQSVPIGVCGEMASDPHFISILLGLGICEFSVTPNIIPILKRLILSMDLKECTLLAEKALFLSTRDDVRELLRRSYQKQLGLL